MYENKNIYKVKLIDQIKGWLYLYIIGYFLKLSPKERQKKVLQAYYNLCKDDPLRHVSHMDVAKKLGVKDYKDERLLYEVIYLKDKGFLEIVEQFGEKVTAYGIDEVENGFPSFV